MSTSPIDGATRDPIALLEQLIGQVGDLKDQMTEIRQEVREIRQMVREIRQDVREIRQEVRQIRQMVGEPKQESKSIDGRLSSLEVGFTQFRNETGGHLDRIEGIFSHVAKKWMEHDEEIARIKRRPG